MSDVEFGSVLICEFVAQDKNNRHMLGGVYSGDIIVSQLPAKVKLALFVEFTPKKSGSLSIILDILLGRKSVAKGVIQAESASAGQPSAFVIPGIELGIDRDVIFTIKASVNGARAVTLKKKRIYKGDVT